MKVIISAAGTGGHINPGIAIANKIKEKEPDSEIIFIGTNRGLEIDLVPRAGYKLKTIDVYGFKKEFSIQNLKHILKTIFSIKDVKKIFEEFKPDLVLGTGGYICGPVFEVATSQKIPTVLHESNAFPGASVKFLSNKVNEIFVGFEETKKRLPNSKKVITTGTPTKIRDLNLNTSQIENIKKELGFKENMPLVLVFGGSQGARSINESMLDIILNEKNKNYEIIWAVGQNQYDEIREKFQDKRIEIQNIKNAKIVPYIYDMESILNACDIVVARSGAMTITEVAKVGKPGIFIPLPFATENHQEYNAKVLSNIGAAKIILDKNLTANTLASEIESILNEKRKSRKDGKTSKNQGNKKC